jgi:hypothetical protein
MLPRTPAASASDMNPSIPAAADAGSAPSWLWSLPPCSSLVVLYDVLGVLQLASSCVPALHGTCKLTPNSGCGRYSPRARSRCSTSSPFIASVKTSPSVCKGGMLKLRLHLSRHTPAPRLPVSQPSTSLAAVKELPASARCSPWLEGGAFELPVQPVTSSRELSVPTLS